MPADLDEMFEALGRQADVLPLAGAAAARRRGRQRTWTRAAVSAAAATVLVLVGVGFALRDPHPRADKPVAPPTRSAPDVPVLGTVSLGAGKIVTAYTAQDGVRAYTTWIRYEDNSAWVIAADLGTGKQAWPARQIVDPDRSVEQILVVPSAVLVLTRAHNGSRPARGLFAFDPGTGAPLWHSDATEDESFVFADEMLVRSSRESGVVEGFDWRTGSRRWQVDQRADPPLRTLGMTVAADEERIDWSGPRADLSDGRFVVVTVAGEVQLRYAWNGDVTRFTSLPPGTGDTMAAYGGWLFSHDEADDSGGPYRIRATGLAGDGGSTIVGTVPGRFVTLAGCGPNRVCVITVPKAGGGGTVITAFDVAKHRQLWQEASKYGGDQIATARGYTMLSAADGGYELFDAKGARIFSADLSTGWLDAGTLLIYAPDGTGRWSRWSIADRKITPLGKPPGEHFFCASTSSLVACPTPNGLTIWRVR